MYAQLSAVASLDPVKLAAVLQKTNHTNLILKVKERGSLEELVDILFISHAYSNFSCVIYYS